MQEDIEKEVPKITNNCRKKVPRTEGYTDYQDTGVVGESNEGAEYSQDQPREMTVLQAENAENSDSE